jgi:hypothetical protein
MRARDAPIELMKILSLLLLLAPVALAAPPEMDAVSWLVGEWEGEGWTMTGPNERHEFRGTEKVESRLGGQVLVVEGRHFAKQAPERPVHSALALISFDGIRKQYRFQAHATGRPALDATAKLEQGVFIWTMETPGGVIRYRIRRTENGEWHESGERSAGPDRWFPFFEMKMKRVR